MKLLKTLSIIFIVIFLGCKKDKMKDNDPGSPLNEGLVAYYPFNGNANDASGNNLNGTAIGTVGYGENRYFEQGKCLQLDGNNSYIRISDHEKLQLKKTMTVYLEFCPENANTSMLIGKRDINAGYQAFGIPMYNQGHPVSFDVIKKDLCKTNNLLSDWSLCQASSANPVLIACWNYLAAVFDGTVQKLYLNGKLVASQNVTFGEMAGCASTEMRIGYWWNNDPLPFTGKIDEVRIYNRALSENEIKQLYKLSN